MDSKTVVVGLIVAVVLVSLGAYFLLRAPFSQPSGNYWIKAIGGEDKTKQNYAPSIIVVEDGYVAIGYSDAFGAGDLDYLVVKLDDNGNHLWSRTVGGPGEDRAYTVEHTADGGYFVAGYTTRPYTGKDFLVVKLRADGDLEWSETIGTPADDVGYSSRRTPDGGYIVVGATEMDNEKGRDVLVVKLRENGELEWAKTIGGSGTDQSAGVARTRDGGFVLVGLTNSGGAGSQDSLVIKLGGSGDVEWAEAVGGKQAESGNWDGIRQTRDNGYILGGTTKSFGAGDDDLFLVKLKADGSLDWSRAVGESGTDACWTLTQTSDGGYIAGGKIQDPSRPSDRGDVLLVRLDSNANFLWAKKLGDETFQEIEEIKEIEGGYVIAGVTNSTGLGVGDFLLAKLNSSGSVDGSAYVASTSPGFVSATPTVTPLPWTAADVISRIIVVDFPATVTTPDLRIENLD